MTKRTIPAGLTTHLAGSSTSLCYLLKITARDGTVLGVTSNNAIVTYDDGAGAVAYSPIVGADIASLDSFGGLEVDNTESNMLIADSGEFTKEKIRAGTLDFAEWVLYRVNYLDLTQGHYEEGRGTTGMATDHEGLLAIIELRGLAQGLKQTFVELYSLTCRARFGSGSQGGCGQAQACNFDAEALWSSHTVGSVGTESDRTFITTDLPAASAGSSPDVVYGYVPGVIQWLTGENAGKYSEVESFTPGGASPDTATIQLRFGTAYTIQAGDTFRIRPDCDKKWATCRDVYSNILNFRGEPYIPLGDEAAQGTPGGQSYPIYPYDVRHADVDVDE